MSVRHNWSVESFFTVFDRVLYAILEVNVAGTLRHYNTHSSLWSLVFFSSSTPRIFGSVQTHIESSTTLKIRGDDCLSPRYLYVRLCLAGGHRGESLTTACTIFMLCYFDSSCALWNCSGHTNPQFLKQRPTNPTYDITTVPISLPGAHGFKD